MSTFYWRQEVFAGSSEEARELCRILDLSQSLVADDGTLSLDDVVGDRPELAICRMPDQRIVLSPTVGLQSQRGADGALRWWCFCSLSTITAWPYCQSL